MKRKLVTALFTFALFLSFGYAVHAESLQNTYEDVTEADLKNSMILSPESAKGFVNGQQVAAVQPILKDGRTLVPLRFISEGFGAKVDFNSKNQSITIVHNGKTISLKLGSKNVSINGQTKRMDVVTRIQNNVTYIPLRDIGEALNKKVVYLQKKEYQSYSLIVLRDHNATAIEHLNLTRVLDLLYQGKAVVYSDRYMVVIKENGKLWISDLSPKFALSFIPFAYKKYIETPNETKLGDIWFKTETSQFYVNHAWDTTEEYMLYRVNGEEISRVAIDKAQIKNVKTYQDDVYYLATYDYGIMDPPGISNLRKATQSNGKWSVTYVGEPGFYYGYDMNGKAYEWSIDSSGITTYGWNRLGETQEERLQSLGYYRIDLNGQHHTLVKS
ncbi:hypothetical protein PAECIP111893_03496 [Paenibacillus plantiphilus]|uniref:Copper amine oxidase-like N-terminal domain-containing protein n=1 Tax=Paenibacillus plantiphilus TaxID=2905650 RepID=A0ABN8GP27_9BACL|nr:copper amine oxidase N-terminal domain-containing protein [Paenibacillus plantiphilus]CAH1212189.1 hypothetical protein PAECIP111893_03496 [Paenibacillus plantiphilus]